jgi:hypothetical protein
MKHAMHVYSHACKSSLHKIEVASPKHQRRQQVRRVHKYLISRTSTFGAREHGITQQLPTSSSKTYKTNVARTTHTTP